MARLGPKTTSLHEDCHGIEPGHFLDDQIDEWRILQAIQPIFSSTKLDWTILPDVIYTSQDDVQKADSDNGFDIFTSALKMLPGIAPVQPLSCAVTDDCLSTLADVLKLLDSLVHDRVLDSERSTLEQFIICTGLPGSWLAEPATSDHTSEYPKLLALEKISESALQSGIEPASVFRSCSRYLVLEQATKVYEEASYKLDSFFSVWDGLRQLSFTDARELFPLTIPTTNWKDPRPAKFACRLFDVLNQRVSGCFDLKARQKIKHAVLLQLDGFQSEGDPIFFDTFFLCKQKSHWTHNRFFFNEPRRPGPRKTHVQNLCAHVYNTESQEFPRTILSISVRESGKDNRNVLYSAKTLDQAHGSNPPTMSLEAHLTKLSSRQSTKLKSTGLESSDSFGAEDTADLALSLARCILYLFESPWADSPWTANCIQFLYRQVSDQILDFRHPYVLGILQDEGSAKTEAPEIRCNRSLISFVRLLFEMETSSIITLHEESPCTQLYKILNETNIYKEFPKYYLAIDACLKFSPALERSKKLHPRLEPGLRIRKILYNTIIRPLEENLSQHQHARTVKRRDPHNQAGTAGFSPAYAQAPHIPKPSRRSPPPRISATHQSLPGEASPIKLLAGVSGAALPQGMLLHSKATKNVHFAAELTDAQLHGSTYAMLSDVGKSYGDEGKLSAWTTWLNDFTKFRKAILPNPVDADNTQRVRVTVIDTGIDYSHPYISSTAWRPYDENTEKHLFCDFVWPDPARDSIADRPTRHDPVDDDGHGTFIAGLLLQLAPDIELSVARIGATRGSLKTDSDVGSKVARAIDYALTEWNADVISLSLSCEQPTSKLRQAVEKAVNQNVVFMAAAGNLGNRSDIPYPAIEERVFKIFATNSHGYAAGFSPQATQPDVRYSYHILGCDVVSAWPCKLQAQAQPKLCLIRRRDHNHSDVSGCHLGTMMSGSSFATPIAAALLGIIYQFYDTNKDKIRLDEGIEGLFKTPKAVSAIFSKMSVGGKQAPYNYLDPTRGSNNFFNFKTYKGGNRNAQGQDYIAFFAQKLAEAINQGNI